MNYEIKDNQIIVNDCENEEVINYINATVYALNGSIESEFWQSKYNNFAVYDYKPVFVQDFKFIIELKEGNVHNKFILFHLTQQLNNIEHLETCLNLTR